MRHVDKFNNILPDDGSIARAGEVGMQAVDVMANQQAVDFGGNSLLRERIFDHMQKQPGYRTARDLAEELSGPMAWWEQPQVAGNKSGGPTNNSAYRLIEGVSTVSRDVDTSTGNARTDEAMSDTERAALIRQLAPVSGHAVVGEIFDGMQDEQLKRYGGELWQLYQGALVLDYLKAISCLRLSGSNGAHQLRQRAHTRDDYPVWFGHFNQVIGEITAAVDLYLPVPQKFQVAMQLSGLIKKGWTGVGDNYEPYVTYPQDKIRAVYAAEIPWHPDHSDALHRLQYGSSYQRTSPQASRFGRLRRQR